MKKPRDNQRSKVYNSQTEAFKLDYFLTHRIDFLKDIIKDIEKSCFYNEIKMNFTSQFKNDPIDIYFTYSNKWEAKGNEENIFLSSEAMNLYILFHEIAHLIIQRIYTSKMAAENKIEDHGKEFCFVYLYLVYNFDPNGSKYTGYLIDSFECYKVKYLVSFMGLDLNLRDEALLYLKYAIIE